MILDGITGARWTAAATPTVRPSPATSSSPRRSTSTMLPSSRIRRVSRRGMGTPWVAGPGSARCRQIRTGRLLPDLGIFRRTARPGEAALGPVEPVVNLTGADRVLVLSIAAAGGGAVTLAESADHHQVMPEPRLRPEPVELRHGVQYPCVIACLKPLHPFGVRSGSLRCEDVISPRRLVLSEFSQRPESVAESSGSQQHNLAIAFSDGITQRPAQPEVVLSVGGLAHADGDPPLVRQPLAKELPQVGGGIEDR